MPAGEAKPDVCVISDGEAGAYCTVGLVLKDTQIYSQTGAPIEVPPQFSTSFLRKFPKVIFGGKEVVELSRQRKSHRKRNFPK